MATTGIQPRGNQPVGMPLSRSHQMYPANYRLHTANGPRRIPPQRAQSQSQSHSLNSAVSFSDPSGVYLKKTDLLIAESVAEIVRNLPNAPLLLQIHSAEDGGRRLQIGKAIEAEWADVRKRWLSGESKSPESTIFVGELEGKIEEDEETKSSSSSWGVVVQGRGPNCGPTCYLLKTDKTSGGAGMDFCVHFCLIRMNNFRNSIAEQFKDSWLLGSNEL